MGDRRNGTAQRAHAPDDRKAFNEALVDTFASQWAIGPTVAALVAALFLPGSMKVLPVSTKVRRQAGEPGAVSRS